MAEFLKSIPVNHIGYSFYFGATIPIASQADQRYAYLLHIPKSYSWDHTSEETKLPLVVLIQDTYRRVEQLRDSYSSFAEEHSCAILVPSFPAGQLHFRDLDSYKLLSYHETRFDQILLSMIDEVSTKWTGVQSAKFCLAGFSGGAQFVSRFLYLYPERLLAVSIGAAGQITRPDKNVDWPNGIKNLEEVFGEKWKVGPNWEEMGKVRIQYVCGGLDNDPNAVGAKDGTGRLDRIRILKRDLEKLGVGVGSEVEIVEGVAHDSAGIKDTVQRFLVKELARNRS